MSGRGPAPKSDDERRRSNAPAAGNWQHAVAVGWQHGDAPKAPTGLTTHAREAWRAWFAAWFASFWTVDDLPALRSMVRLYDQVERGEFQRHPELRLMMDAYGVTPKGQQDRRWRPPLADVDAAGSAGATSDGSPYGHLRVAT